MKTSMGNPSSESLVDIRDVQIKEDLPIEDRVRSFVEQIKNPYCFKVGSVVVNVSFSDNGQTLNDRFVEMLSIL